MIKNLLFTAIAVVLSVHSVNARSTAYQERAAAYIARYKSLAMAEQRRSGIPAAITLGQGILETEAGASELSTVANNHFGIKCKKDWTGETFAHDDDAPQECFRKYGDAVQSYRDHSDYLRTSKRYASCFAIDAADYAGWARELRKCGYATNPKYAQILVKIIEDFHLQDYTYAVLGRASGAEAPVLLASTDAPVAAAMMAADKKGAPGEVVPEHDTRAATPVYGQLIKKDGARGFWARKGDVLLEYAIQFKVRYAKILELNGLPDAPLHEDRFVYIEKVGKVVDGILAKDYSEPAPVALTAAPAVAASSAVPTSVEAPQAVTSGKEETAPANVPPANVAAVAAVPAPAPQVASPQGEAPDAEEAGAESPAAEAAAPMDEFARLKARLDKAVYASSDPRPAQAATAPPVQQAASSAEVKSYHTVAAGETMFGIAKRYGITMKNLMDLNGLKNFEAIRVGQKLRVK